MNGLRESKDEEVRPVWEEEDDWSQSGVKDHSQTSGGLQADWAWFCDRFGFGYEEDDGIEGGGVLLNSNLCVTGIGQTA